MYMRAATRNLPALVCLLSRDIESIEAYYVMRKINAVSRMTSHRRIRGFRAASGLNPLPN